MDFVAAGVIDQDYRGNVGVILFNFGAEEFKGNQLMSQLVLLSLFKRFQYNHV